MDGISKFPMIKVGVLVGVGLLVGCSAQLTAQSPNRPAPQPIRIDGSSTVFPISQTIAKAYQQQGNPTQITVEFSGTGGGFKKFCAGETDISNASRPILQKEMAACKQAGVSYLELPIAFDALTIVVHPQNDWARDITLAELKTMWEPAAQGKIKTWKQVRASWPDRPLQLYGPGADSGTFDYFTEVVMGQDAASRTDYTASEDDNTLVAGVSQNPDALGYFGFAYYEAKQAQLKALAVDNGKGAIQPSQATVKKAQYQPFSRPLLIYVNVTAVQNRPEVRAFVEFYLQNAPQVVNTVGYIPLPPQGYELATKHFHSGKVGTVFAGLPQPNLTISELLRKQAIF